MVEPLFGDSCATIRYNCHGHADTQYAHSPRAINRDGTHQSDEVLSALAGRLGCGRQVVRLALGRGASRRASCVALRVLGVAVGLGVGGDARREGGAGRGGAAGNLTLASANSKDNPDLPPRPAPVGRSFSGRPARAGTRWRSECPRSSPCDPARSACAAKPSGRPDVLGGRGGGAERVRRRYCAALRWARWARFSRLDAA